MHLWSSPPSAVFDKDIPFHWPSSARANGKEGATLTTGPSTERKAWRGHDIKRSDWHDPARLEPVRQHKNHRTITRSQGTKTPHIHGCRFEFTQDLTDLDGVGLRFVELQVVVRKEFAVLAKGVRR
jgi:hypothetical protein